MLPLRLTIEGIYSYQERQTIDFSALTQAGLFGIFGIVGSGKSSILEAITFALYGETERLNSRDRRSYNMLNLKSNHFYLEFEFLNFEDRHFRVIREFKRSNKKFDDVKPTVVQYYEKKGENWLPLEQAFPQKIIGLSYDNFKRTIIIPQGQFKEFLELGAKDRTEMMKEIFNLHKFDLSDNIAKVKKENGEKLSFKEGLLKGFELVDENIIGQQKEKFLEEKEKLKYIEKEFIQLKKEYEQLKTLKNDYELLNIKKKDLLNFQKQEPEIQNLQEKINIYEKIEKLFKNLLENKLKIQKEVHLYQSRKEIEERKLQEIEEQLTNLTQKIDSIQGKYDQLPQTKIIEEDLRQILSIIPLKNQIITEEKRTKEGSAKIKEEEKKFKNQKIILAELETDIENLKKQRINHKLLLEIGNWYEKYSIFRENESNQRAKIIKIEEELESILGKLEEIMTSKGLLLIDYNKKIILEKEKFEKEKQSLNQRINQLEVQSQLARYSQALHQGEACPLCGSLEHPHITHFEDVSKEMDAIKETIKNIDTKQEELRQTISLIEKYIEKKQIFEVQLSSEKNILKRIEEDLSGHRAGFVWKEFSLEDNTLFLEQQKFATELEIQIDEKEKSYKKLFKETEELQQKIEKYRILLNDIYNNIASLQGNILSKKESIKVLDYEEYGEREYNSLEEEFKEIAFLNIQIEQDYQELIENKNKINLLYSQNKVQLKNTLELLEKNKKEYSIIEEQIKKELEEGGLEIERVEEILKNPIPVEENRLKIQKFYVHYKVIQEHIAQLERKFSENPFNIDIYLKIEEDFTSKEGEMKSANEICIKLDTELRQLEKSFEEKKEIIKEVEFYRQKNENIKLLDNIFRGQGFIQYISSIYMQQLCEYANERFRQMTRGQLSLQVNENNEFEVIDYLNEGKTRSVKTLSGGQAFQVSLSLALALAESVQSEAITKRNFFFIDEGFGTQDLDSVNIVFESITKLLKENRIVGIISHVEELKERIPISLTITKDIERGSLINMS